MKKSRKNPNPMEASAALPANAGEPVCGGRVGPYVVGIGASAGVLEAFEQFFSHLPPDTGMAFVLVQHLDPTTHKGGHKVLVLNARKVIRKDRQSALILLAMEDITHSAETAKR